jgi:CSLREA domain-containing protein
LLEYPLESLMSKRAKAISAAVILSTFFGCSGSSGDNRTSDNTVTAVAVSPSAITLNAVGEQVQLSAIANNASGLVVCCKNFVWSSSAGIVAIDSSTGLATVTGDGVATITASTDGISGTATVTSSLVVDRVSVEPEDSTVLVGQSIQLNAFAFDRTGIELLNRSITWSSDDDAMADVDASGLVTGLATGDQGQPVDPVVLITASVEGVSGVSGVQVRLQPMVNVADDVDDGKCDDLHCSLREALTAANWGHTTGSIRFDITGPGPHTIQPLSPLPGLLDVPVFIDGYSQPGARQNEAPRDSGTDALLMIEIDGSLAPGAIRLGSGSLVKGLALNRGMYLSINGSNNTIQGNFIGLDVVGSVAQGSSVGVLLTGDVGSSGNLIGGTAIAARNVISGNTVGIRIVDNGGNYVQGNLIGTDASGTMALGNGTGIEIGAVGNTIGGSVVGSGNVISANAGAGIEFQNREPPVSLANVVQGNIIGAEINGIAPLGNGGDGIVIGRTSIAGVNVEQLIGGAGVGEGNIIAFNGGNGVTLTRVLPENRFATGTAVLGNAIFENNGLAIDLDNDGVTENDLGDVDGGPNNLQNFPDLLTAVAGDNDVTVTGSLNSEPSADYRIEFFSNSACDPAGTGEGERFIGVAEVTTDNLGNASFVPTIPVVVVVGSFITATATASDGSTSELSQCVVVM